MSSASAESDHAAQKGDNVETQDFASSGGNYHIRAKRRRKILRLQEGITTSGRSGDARFCVSTWREGPGHAMLEAATNTLPIRVAM